MRQPFRRFGGQTRRLRHRPPSYAAIDAGTDVVIGHHAHIMRGINWYKGGHLPWAGQLRHGHPRAHPGRRRLGRTHGVRSEAGADVRLRPGPRHGHTPVPSGEPEHDHRHHDLRRRPRPRGIRPLLDRPGGCSSSLGRRRTGQRRRGLRRENLPGRRLRYWLRMAGRRRRNAAAVLAALLLRHRNGSGIRAEHRQWGGGANAQQAPRSSHYPPRTLFKICGSRRTGGQRKPVPIGSFLRCHQHVSLQVHPDGAGGAPFRVPTRLREALPGHRYRVVFS
ncbi:CapA family protein [Arthrobacter liuii]|uniref:CapA family protein n=1 Tax=Arthrobacter liuii TaxID=1476996 RepID=UPI003570DED0